jgi:hypothetical protein
VDNFDAYGGSGDLGDAERSEQTRWSASTGLVAVVWSVFVGCALGAAFASDARGRLLLGVAAAGVAIVGAQASFARPRLAVTPSGVRVRTLLSGYEWRWSQLGIRLREHRRLGRCSTLLELDGADSAGVERMLLLGWFDLGSAPDEVATQLFLRRPD